MPRHPGNYPPAELLVRQAVIKFCLSAPGRSVQLPSTRDYALRFGFTVRTITTELSKLVKQGWIRGQKGLGYFSCPEHFQSSKSPDPVIGMTFGDTLDLYYDVNRWEMQAHAGSALVRHNYTVRPLLSIPQKPDTVTQEMDRLGVSGAVVIFCPDIWKDSVIAYADSGKKVVCMLEPVGNLPFVGIEWAQCGRDIAAKILECPERGAVLWCDFHDESNGWIRGGVQAALANRRMVNVAPTPQEMLATLEAMLKEKNFPTAVFCHNGWAADIAAVFTRCGCDPYRDTTLISSDAQLCRTPDFRGITYGYPFEEMGNAAAMLLSESRRGRKILLPMKVSRLLPE